MARYSIIHACGHQANVHFYGPINSRARALSRMDRSRPCQKCSSSALGSFGLRPADIPEAMHPLFGSLPPIDGGTKIQDAWARRIRSKKLELIQQELDRVRCAADSDPGKLASFREDQSVFLAIMKDFLEEHTDTEWWIDQRNATLLDIMLCVRNCGMRGMRTAPLGPTRHPPMAGG